MSDPLSEANPKSLDEIFSSDPGSLSEKELSLVVKELREQSARWTIAETAGKKSAPKMPKTSAPVSLSLKDLGL